MTTNASKEDRLKPPRSSPALYFLRPVWIAAGGLLAWGLLRRDTAATIAAAGLGLLSVLLAVVLHVGYRGRKERDAKVRCG